MATLAVFSPLLYLSKLIDFFFGPFLSGKSKAGAVRYQPRSASGRLLRVEA